MFKKPIQIKFHVIKYSIYGLVSNPNFGVKSILVMG